MAVSEGKKQERDVKDLIRAGIRRWKSENLSNSAFSQQTEAWNHFNSQTEALVEAIFEEFPK